MQVLDIHIVFGLFVKVNWDLVGLRFAIHFKRQNVTDVLGDIQFG